MTRGHLTLVHGFKQLALQERLLAEAMRLFPGDAKQQEKRRERWVEAKLFLVNRPIKVLIGQRAPKHLTFPRSMREAGIQGEIA